MKVIKDITSLRFDKKTIVTIGTFDGVHLGHQKIIKRLQSNSNAANETVIITFSQHPRFVLQSDNSIKLLNTNDEKIALLDNFGIDNLIILEFDKQLSGLSGEEFVKSVLVDKLNVQKIIIGYDHKFGRNRSSDIHDLIYFGKKYHFDVEQISAEELDEITISSTRIRKAIEEGKIELANNFLGYPYCFKGKVVKGKQLGRTIGFPTANIQIENPLKLIPKLGVYIVQVSLRNKTYKGMMNIGNRPTVDGTSTTIEVNLFDCDFEFYEEELKVSVLKFLREEQKFSSVEELKLQLQKDKKDTEAFFV
ncbi:bifunctional riboflavin kinase/FAD synthetase [Flavobacterium sp. H122]|uniref:bifunctional riboflavin kinase/FAD synthetase n=1 Tax=Flavobacterium sp. H122 TaxID=2529860 RepID=UPI0010AAB023|nr:bifunctional riboflavin kinase/FAD synthetase [Flavobacterium sp. H122]